MSRRAVLRRLTGLLPLIALAQDPARAQNGMIRILAYGDSLTAGYGLRESEAFPARLEAALRARGQQVTVINGGVSGDTSRGGLERLEWTLSDPPNAVILELGANDALRGISAAETRANLRAMLRKLADRKIPVLLAGMRAPRNLGSDYENEFNPIFAELATEFGVEFYPFFLEGVAAEPTLNQPDGMHPNAKGVERIVEQMLDPVLKLINRLRG
ncbi:MAG: arylesterase [Parvibaculaceae bacterium]